MMNNNNKSNTNQPRMFDRTSQKNPKQSLVTYKKDDDDDEEVSKKNKSHATRTKTITRRKFKIEDWLLMMMTMRRTFLKRLWTQKVLVKNQPESIKNGYLGTMAKMTSTVSKAKQWTKIHL